MIDSREIRVGIVIINPSSKIEFKVTEKNIGAVMCNHIKEPYKGVLITEEKLKKYGFKFKISKTKGSNYRDYTLKDKRGRVVYYLNDFTFDFMIEFNRIIRGVKYIHKIQNLIFDINNISLKK